MVRAILDGRKTLARRIITWPAWVEEAHAVAAQHLTRVGFVTEFYEGKGRRFACPYGQPGDRLYVKEAIRCEDGGADFAHVVFCADGAPTKADAWPWKRKTLPGMFMPRGLRRITLEITDVRVERLQEISEDDAIAELGLREVFDGGWTGLPPPWTDTRDPVESFARLWDRINGTGSWERNPWVWVVSFNRIERGARAA